MKTSARQQDLFHSVQALEPAVGHGSRRLFEILSPHAYISPRGRSLTHAQREIRRIAYELKEPTAEAITIAAADMAALLASVQPQQPLVLMPVPTSKGSVDPNRKLAEAIAARIRKADPRRQVSIMATVTRKHPVESSCVRRRKGGRGLRLEDHAIIRTGRTPDPAAACFFIDNVATEGTTLTACHMALGRGDAIVFADKHHP